MHKIHTCTRYLVCLHYNKQQHWKKKNRKWIQGVGWKCGMEDKEVHSPKQSPTNQWTNMVTLGGNLCSFLGLLSHCHTVVWKPVIYQQALVTARLRKESITFSPRHHPPCSSCWDSMKLHTPSYLPSLTTRTSNLKVFRISINIITICPVYNLFNNIC
jgi:hypothetical protein